MYRILRRHKRVSILAVAACMGLIMLVQDPASYSHPRVQASTPRILVQLGPAEVVGGPGSVADNPFHTLLGTSLLKAYVGNQATWGYEGGSLETLRQLPEAVIREGTDFDTCGAWLNAVWSDGSVVRGWYHAETDCDYANMQTHKSVAYAESYDGGRNFVKPNYPYNQVLTSPTKYTAPDTDDEGDHRVIRIGDYLYMFYLANHPSWQIYVARSHISDKGLPGTWVKYYNGAFTEPGLGGEASPVASWTDLATSWVSYSSYLGSYIGFSGVWDNTSGRQAGFGLSTSLDGLIDWNALVNSVTSRPYTLLPFEGSWDRAADDGDLVAYPSFVSIYGNSDTVDDAFWLYYMYLNSGDGFDRRYLLRRKVRFSHAVSTDPVDTVPRVALARYQYLDDTWVTTTNTNRDYELRSIVDYLFTEQVPNTVPVYDCYIEPWNDHMLVPNDESCDGGDVRHLRRAGWISQVPFENSIQVYRCWDAATTNHFVSADPACEGRSTEWSMGYLSVMPPLPQNQFVALSGYRNADIGDSWVTSGTPPITYTFESRIGYLFSNQRVDTIPVYDCYIDFWDDHMLVPQDSSCGGAQNLGLLGWIATKPLPNTIPIYRCFDQQATNHFLWLDATCNGRTYEWRVGYVAVTPSTDWQVYIPIAVRHYAGP